ncbi:uncharacterized protein ACMZJ9_010045 [Mantella aurantiaca]
MEEPRISGVLEKRRQNLKFHWRTYQFILKGMNLSYFKMRGSNDKEGELWGTIDVRDVVSLLSVDIMGSRYPMEVTLRNGKVILLAADSNTERGKWLKAIQEKMASIRKRRTSDTPVVREKTVDANRGICDWMRKSDPVGETGGQDCSTGADELGDLDSFIDQAFRGITFNRQSEMKKVESQRSLDKSKYGGNNT